MGTQQAHLVVVGVAGFAVLASGLTAWLLGRSGLAILGDAIVRTSGLGRTVYCDHLAVARVIEAPLLLTRLSGISETWLLFLSQDDRALTRAYADYYPPEQLARFRSVLGVPWHRAQVTTVADARRAFPGSFGWPWAHIWLTTLATLTGGIITWGILASAFK